MPDALAMAYHNLSSMLDAGVPILRSLNTVTPGLKPRMQKAFLALAEGVSQGNTLAETMVLHRRVFEPVDVMIVEIAEKSGNLPDLIGLLSKWHEMSHRMLRRMMSGLLLPIMVLTIAAFVFPLPAFVLGELTAKAYLLKVSGILALFWIPAAIIVAIVRLTPKTGLLRRILDHIALRIPILGAAIHRLAVSRFCWAFHMLSKAGVPMTESVEMSISVTGNLVVGDLFRPSAASVAAGGLMSEGFSPKLPFDLVELWKAGEETGQLDDISKRLADTYTERAEFWFHEFTRWFPRIIYFLICIMLILMIIQLAGGIVSMY